jgi:hypothetical protein
MVIFTLIQTAQFGQDQRTDVVLSGYKPEPWQLHYIGCMFCHLTNSTIGSDDKEEKKLETELFHAFAIFSPI